MTSPVWSLRYVCACGYVCEREGTGTPTTIEVVCVCGRRSVAQVHWVDE